MQRDIVISDFINAGFKPILPEGSYYALVDISNCFSNDEIASEQLILKTKVATIPARIFFTSVVGQKYIRVCFAKCVPTLSEAPGVLPRGEGGGKQ